MFFNGLKRRDILILISIALIILIYSIWQFYPYMFLHNDSMVMIRYFDHTEYSILNAIVETYKHPFQYPRYAHTVYPMIFYRVVEIIIYPIFFVKGFDVNLLSDAIRLGGLVSILLLFMVILLYSRQIFCSFIPGVITVLLILSGGTHETESIFGFFMSTRPNPFELLMLFLTFYSFSIYFRDRMVKHLFYGIIFSAFVFSTKMDSVFLLPIISYLIYNSIINKEIDLKKALKVFRFINYCFSITMFIAVPAIVGASYYFIFVRHRTIIAKTFYESVSPDIIYKVIALEAIILLGIILFGLIIILLEKKIQKHISSELILNRGIARNYIIFSSILTICVVYALAFLITNPHLITDPIHSLSYFSFFIYIFIRPTQLIGESPRGGDPFMYLKLLMGMISYIAGGLILIVSFTGLLKHFIVDKTKDYVNKSLLLLLSYSIIKFTIVATIFWWSDRNFIISIVILIYLFFGYSVNCLIKDNRIKYIIVLLLFLTLLPVLIERDNIKSNSRANDAIYYIPKWIDKNVPPEKVVVSYDVSLLGKYKDNVIITDKLNFIKPFSSPDYIIISDMSYLMQLPKLVAIPEYRENANGILNSIKNDYDIEAKIKNQNPYTAYGGKYIFIFKKKASST